MECGKTETAQSKIIILAKGRNAGGVELWAERHGVRYRLKQVVRHSPDGMEIGYAGSGPSDCALTICFLFNRSHLYQAFKAEVIAKLDRKQDHELTFDFIKETLDRLQGSRL